MNHWKGLLVTLAGAIGAVWLGITWADDKLRKIEKVPALEVAVVELQRARKEAEIRNEERQAQLRLDNAAILTKLDQLLEHADE